MNAVTNLGSSTGRRSLASTPFVCESSLQIARSGLLMVPGAPRQYTDVFRVERDAMSISVYGLCGGDELYVEQVAMAEGCPPIRIGCCITPEGDPRVAYAIPFMSACNPVSLSECQPRIIIDQVGAYRLKLVARDGCTPDSLGRILVTIDAETVAKHITPSMRGYGPELANNAPRAGNFEALVGLISNLNDTEMAVLQSLLGSGVDVDAVACALDGDLAARRVIRKIVNPIP